MNQSSKPPHSGSQWLELRSLGTIAAALVRCQHPSDYHARVVETPDTKPLHIMWCALCGALSSGPGAAEPWQPPALLSRLARPQFQELSQLLHVLRRGHDLHARDAAGDIASEDTVRDALASLAPLATTHLARDLERLDDAIADMPTRPTDPLPFR